MAVSMVVLMVDRLGHQSVVWMVALSIRVADLPVTATPLQPVSGVRVVLLTLHVVSLDMIQFAAAACMAGVITLFALKNGQERQTNTICSINGVSKDFCMQVNDYESNIQQKLSSFNSNETSIPKEVEEEITLDSPMKVVLLNELKKHPDNPKIKEAILKYYKAKLELIQRIEELLKKQDKTMNDETDNSTVI